MILVKYCIWSEQRLFTKLCCNTVLALRNLNHADKTLLVCWLKKRGQNITKGRLFHLTNSTGVGHRQVFRPDVTIVLKLMNFCFWLLISYPMFRNLKMKLSIDILPALTWNLKTGIMVKCCSSLYVYIVGFGCFLLQSLHYTQTLFIVPMCWSHELVINLLSSSS